VQGGGERGDSKDKEDKNELGRKDEEEKTA
jgi:hypothetical protein